MAYEATTFEQESQTSAEGLKAQTQQVMERAKARGAETVEDTVDLVRRNPGKTVAVSLLVGAAIGALIVNAAMSEEESRWDRLSGMTNDAWDALKDRSEDALTV